MSTLTGNGRRSARSLAVAALILLAGCATVQNPDPRDPHESFNRAMFEFNEGFDEAIGKPVATVWKTVLPYEVRIRVRNFFSNIQDFMIGVNNLLQGKPDQASDDFARVLLNSTFGLAGLHDIASEAGLEKHNEDFGQTFAVWGMEDGPYFVWPFFGAHNLRDTFGLALDLVAAPVLAINDAGTRYWMAGVFLVNERADLLDATTILDDAAIDKYVARRDIYFQRRRDLIFDGNPPRERPPGREPQSDAQPPAPRSDAASSEPEPSAWSGSYTEWGTIAPGAPSNDVAVISASRGMQQ
jgi:phospholipid-binding lipoprotein MlaA